jgi:hypothetical protein
MPPPQHAPKPARTGDSARPEEGPGDSSSPLSSHPVDQLLDETDIVWEDEVTPVVGMAVLALLDPSVSALIREAHLKPVADPRGPNDRATVAPPVPEGEYVAQMMGKVQHTEPPRRAVGPFTPPPPTVKAPTRIQGGEPPSSRKGAAAREAAKPPEDTDEAPSALRRRPTQPGFALSVSDSAPPPSSARVRAMQMRLQPAESEALTLDLTESLPPGAVRRTEGSNDAPRRPDSPSPGERSRDAPTLAFRATDGDALELVGARAQSRPPKPSAVDLRQVRDRFDTGDFTGALAMSEGILGQDPDNADAQLYAEHCRDVLKQMHLSRLGGLRRVPLVAIGPEQLRWLSLDHRAGFLLSLVDGRSTFDEVLDMSGMSDLEALRLLVQLLEQNVIKVS